MRDLRPRQTWAWGTALVCLSILAVIAFVIAMITASLAWFIVYCVVAFTLCVAGWFRAFSKAGWFRAGRR